MLLQLTNNAQARKLKKLGFDVPVRDLYIIEKTRISVPEKMEIDYNWNHYSYTVSRPTIAEALEWVRRKYDCICEVIMVDSETTKYSGLFQFPETPVVYIRQFTVRSRAESELLTKIIESLIF